MQQTTRRFNPVTPADTHIQESGKETEPVQILLGTPAVHAWYMGLTPKDRDRLDQAINDYDSPGVILPPEGVKWTTKAGVSYNVVVSIGKDQQGNKVATITSYT